MSDEHAHDLQPGSRLDRYELICPIAKGGMAHVWVARLQGKHGFEKLLALKTILPQYARDDRFQRMFLDEAAIACRIEHPNVAQTYDLGEENGVLYLAMEWIEGDSLSKVMRAAGGLPLGIALRLLADACAGLHAAHELCGPDGALLAVVHRDVSPQNVLVSVQGHAKVIDFGIAKAKNRRSEDTGTGVMKGKPSFMAPEQAMGSAVDRGADVWAIGAILYMILAGHPPYEGENPLELLLRLTTGAAYLPLAETVPPPVVAIVTRCLQFRRQDRYETAAALQHDLEAAMEHIGDNTTANDVSSFVQKHLGPRLRARREAVALGLRAAADRQRVQAQLESTASDLSATPAQLFPKPRAASPAAAETEVTAELTPSATDSVIRSRAKPVLVGLALLGVALAGVVVARRSPSPAAPAASATQAAVAAVTSAPATPPMHPSAPLPAPASATSATAPSLASATAKAPRVVATPTKKAPKAPTKTNADTLGF